MAVVDKNKLLGKAEKGGDLMVRPTTSLVGSSGGKITETSDEKDVVYTISTKLVKVDKFLKGNLDADKAAQKKEQKQKEDELRAQQEQDTEKPDKDGEEETPKQLIPKMSFLDGIKKFVVASGLRYDLAVKDPEYVKELVTHHVGGYLKVAPEHSEEGPLSKMMKPGMDSYYEFKEMFERFSKEAGKKQYLIPYFISAHPGSTNKDMMHLSLWLKQNKFRVDQVQNFYPSPMASATTMYFTGKNPLKPLKRNADDPIFSAKSKEQRTLHKAFLRYHDPDNWPMLRKALRRMGKAELIGHGEDCLVPPESRREKEIQRRESLKAQQRPKPRGAINKRRNR